MVKYGEEFRKSPLKTSELARHANLQFVKPLELKTDVNSLVGTMNRFLKLRLCMQNVKKDLHLNETIQEDTFQVLQQLMYVGSRTIGNSC